MKRRVEQKRRTVAVIGAGVAGLTCANALRERGVDATVFEKSRGLGGRLATRRTADGLTFDHGAQYMTARSGAFRKLLEDAIASSSAGRWSPLVHDDLDGGLDKWIVGSPGMNAPFKPLAKGIKPRLSTRVMSVTRDKGKWRLLTDNESSGELFDAVVSTAPAPQALELLWGESEMNAGLSAVSIAPCWTLMVAFAKPLEPGFDLWRRETHDLAWIARNGSKPGRREDRDCWVVHAGADWSEKNLELNVDEAASVMMVMLRDAMGTDLPDFTHATAHRWRYARTTTTAGKPFIRSQDGTLYAGGDWCLGARVEAAYESGLAIAEDLCKRLAD